jgi:hypothetical protein
MLDLKPLNLTMLAMGWIILETLREEELLFIS